MSTDHELLNVGFSFQLQKYRYYSRIMTLLQYFFKLNQPCQGNHSDCAVVRSCANSRLNAEYINIYFTIPKESQITYV